MPTFLHLLLWSELYKVAFLPQTSHFIQCYSRLRLCLCKIKMMFRALSLQQETGLWLSGMKPVIGLWFCSTKFVFQAMAVPPSGPQKTFLNTCLKLCRRAAGASTMLPSLVVSALFILLTLVLANGARRLLDRLVKDSFMRLLLQEAIAAFELCACCFELIIGIRTFWLFRHLRCCICNCRSWFRNEVPSDTSYFEHVLLYRKLTFNVNHRGKSTHIRAFGHLNVASRSTRTNPNHYI